MIHLGDITQIHGYDIPPVDVITGGSPCQDLSVAGKRAGLEGERSGLFMEQIRVIKEMRDATANDDIRMVKPRWAIWENVPGALSSGTPKGADFQAVLTEFVRIAEPNAPDVPLPAKWGGAGVLMGRSWSIAYKIHDAQFWGVPQRRRRIAVVADFAGHAAPWVLFGSEFRGETEDGEPDKTERHPGISDEREIQPQSPRLSGDTQQSGETWEGAAGDPEAGVGETDTTIPINTMVGTRESDEKRTTFGVGNPGDSQFTISAAHSHAVFFNSDESDKDAGETDDGIIYV